MDEKSAGSRAVDEYIRDFPEPVRERLRELRALIRRVAPTATEKISYRIPTFYLNGNLVHFAAFAHHVGFYPTANGVDRFKSELSDYVTSKGAVRFPHSMPLPTALIERIVRFRVAEATAKERT